jgi:sodium-dependent dicarboxylate transporter 2/3/5
VSAAAIVLVVVVCRLIFADAKLFRAAVVAGVCLVLWLSEVVPLYATTMLLWVGIVTLLGPLDPRAFSLPRVLSAAANPVMALFFGGFALSVAASKYGIDVYIASWMIRASRGRRLGLLAAVMAGTALLSMWMSNIAAAAMMLATLGPLLGSAAMDAGDGRTDAGAPSADDLRFRTALLLGVAFAANFGGMGTPIGTGPNLVAIGAIADRYRITFLDWVAFGAPLAAGMTLLAFALLAWLYRVHGSMRATVTMRPSPPGGSGRAVVVIFFAAVTAWLLEPLHGVPAAVTALAVAAVLFAGRLLDRRDLQHLEWDTLLLIAGGLTLGELFNASGLATAIAGAVDWHALPRPVLLMSLVFACATLSAVASNTAASAMLIQIALGIIPSPSVAVLVAMGASMGVPFVISSPPNSMAYGRGGLTGRDFLVTGTILMLVGCTVLALTGPAVLRWLGLP